MTETIRCQPERRRCHRTQLQMRIQCIRFDPDGGDVIDILDTVDISRCGLGAISERPFYPGQRILLCMPLTSTAGRRNIYATVVRCRQEEEGYNIGLEFDTASMNLQHNEAPEFAAA